MGTFPIAADMSRYKSDFAAFSTTLSMALTLQNQEYPV
jgi:hypothetical protein